MIGVFDSGIGGLSVLKDIRRLMPQADLHYVADRADTLVLGLDASAGSVLPF